VAGEIGVRVRLKGDSSGAKRALDDVSSSIGKLGKEAQGLNFMGSGETPGFHSRAVPPFAQPPAGALPPGGTLPRFGNQYVPPFYTPYNSQISPGTLPRFGNQYVPPFYTPYNSQISPGTALQDARKAVDTNQKIGILAGELEKLGETIKTVNEDLREAVAKGDTKAQSEISSSLNNLKAYEARIKNELKGLEREKEKEGGRGDPGQAMGKYFSAHMAQQATQMIVEGVNTVIGSKKMLAGGDALGSAIAKEKGLGQLFGGGAGMALGAVIGSLVAPGVGTAVGAAIGGSLGKLLGGLKGDFKEIDAQYSAQYKKALPSIDMFYQRYGTGIAGKSGAQNSREGLDWYNRASNMSLGTGKTAADLIQAAAVRGTYGNISGTRALAGARDDLMWERFTGANLGSIQRVAGLGMRYGGDERAVQKAYNGLAASGMGKGQFDEFLTSMQRIMEDGIEKGFVKGADEIAGNMSLLSRLSGGNPLWTGEQGANRLMKMNEGTAKATELNSVTDVLTFGVAKRLMSGNGGGASQFASLMGNDRQGNLNGYFTGTYVDMMQLMERGVSPEMLKGQFDAVRDIEEGNKAGQIERFRQMYNLNYTGAAKVFEMSQNTEGWTEAQWKEHANKIKEMQTDKNYQSDSQRLQDVMTEIDKKLVNIGKGKFDTLEMPALLQAVRNLKKEENGTTDPAQILTPPPLPGGEPVDLHPVMAEELYRPRSFWESIDTTVPTRYFLENDQNSRAYIDAAMEETGKSLDEIISFIVGGRNRDRFDANFQEFLDTAMVGHETAVIDAEEYKKVHDLLVRSLQNLGVSIATLVATNNKLIETDRDLKFDFVE